MAYGFLIRPARSRSPASAAFCNFSSKSICSSSGFTLVELMIVVSVLGLLVSYAIPAYNQARSAALIGSIVGDLIGYAKACAVINASGVGDKPTPPPRSSSRGGVVILDGCDGLNRGGKLEAVWGDIGADGISCLSRRSSLSHRKAIIELVSETSDSSVMSCNFQ